MRVIICFILIVSLPASLFQSSDDAVGKLSIFNHILNHDHHDPTEEEPSHGHHHDTADHQHQNYSLKSGKIIFDHSHTENTSSEGSGPEDSSKHSHSIDLISSFVVFYLEAPLEPKEPSDFDSKNHFAFKDRCPPSPYLNGLYRPPKA